MAAIPALVAVITSMEVFVQNGNARSQSVAVGKTSQANHSQPMREEEIF
jgi:hypothetical protein